MPMQRHSQSLVQWPLTIFYDHSCPICRLEMENLKIRDLHDKLVLVDASRSENLEAEQLPVAQEELMRFIHARDAGGVLYKGVDVFELAYGAVHMAWVVRVLEMPGVGAWARRLYPWVAQNRNRFPRWLTSGVFGLASRRAARKASHKARCQPGDACRLD